MTGKRNNKRNKYLIDRNTMISRLEKTGIKTFVGSTEILSFLGIIATSSQESQFSEIVNEYPYYLFNDICHLFQVHNPVSGLAFEVYELPIINGVVFANIAAIYKIIMFSELSFACKLRFIDEYTMKTGIKTDEFYKCDRYPLQKRPELVVNTNDIHQYNFDEILDHNTVGFLLYIIDAKYNAELSKFLNSIMKSGNEVYVLLNGMVHETKVLADFYIGTVSAKLVAKKNSKRVTITKKFRPVYNRRHFQRRELIIILCLFFPGFFSEALLQDKPVMTIYPRPTKFHKGMLYENNNGKLFTKPISEDDLSTDTTIMRSCPIMDTVIVSHMIDNGWNFEELIKYYTYISSNETDTRKVNLE